MYSDFNTKNSTFRKTILPSPIYDQMQFVKFKAKDDRYDSAQKETKYIQEVLKLIISIVKELGYDHVKNLSLVNKVLMLVKEESYMEVLPREQELFNAVIAVIRDTVRVNDGQIFRVHPSHHGTEPGQSMEPQELIVKTINMVIYTLPVIYTEEIILLKPNNVQDNLSLYNYENGITDFYRMEESLVHRREVINVPLVFINKMRKFTLEISMPMDMIGVGRFLNRRDKLSLRLVNKSCYNDMLQYKNDFKGRFVFDILFLWFQERYYMKKTVKRQMLSEEEYREWKRPYKERAKNMIVNRKYALHEFVNNNVYHDNPTPLTCDIHSIVGCKFCLIGEDISPYIESFFGYSDFSPEVSSLIKFLIENKILYLDDISKFVNDTIVIFREEHLLFYMFWYLRKLKRNIPLGVVRVFSRYRKKLIYWFISYRSALSMFKSRRPPDWSDMIFKNAAVYRRSQGEYKLGISIDFRRYDCMFRYDFALRQYVRSTIAETFFQIPMMINHGLLNPFPPEIDPGGQIINQLQHISSMVELPQDYRRVLKRNRNQLESDENLSYEVVMVHNDDEDTSNEIMDNE